MCTVDTIDPTLQSIYSQYPALSGYNFNLIDSRGKQSKYGGQLEFYPPNEIDNPTPGRPTVEVFNKNIQGKAYEQLIAADMLHYLPEVDSQYSALRNKFKNSLTEEQKEIDRNAYKRDKDSYGENRTYDEWHNKSRLDAYIRGGLFPEVNPGWKDNLTPRQLNIIKEIDEHLRAPKKQR